MSSVHYFIFMVDFLGSWGRHFSCTFHALSTPPDISTEINRTLMLVEIKKLLISPWNSICCCIDWNISIHIIVTDNLAYKQIHGTWCSSPRCNQTLTIASDCGYSASVITLFCKIWCAILNFISIYWELFNNYSKMLKKKLDIRSKQCMTSRFSFPELPSWSYSLA